jgi:hypothetical protein
MKVRLSDLDEHEQKTAAAQTAAAADRIFFMGSSLGVDGCRKSRLNIISIVHQNTSTAREKSGANW